MRIPFAEPWIDEEEIRNVYNAVSKKMLRYGKYVKLFEDSIAEYVGIKYAIAVSSGTAALHVALLALDVGPGDEVIVPSFSCAPPALATVLCGARPVFADIEEETLNIDPHDVLRKITPKTKAIIPIHYAGHPAEMDELMEICEKHDIYLVEDAAEALGAEYKGRKAGSMGDVAVLSFSPNKTITTGEGGMVLTNDPDIAERCKVIKDYGQKGRFNYVMLGNNYRMTELQAAIGVAQIKKIKEIIKRKHKIAKIYNNMLADHVRIPVEKPYVKHAYMSYYIRVPVKIRNKLIKHLKMRGIETRTYFPPLHKQPFYSKFCNAFLSVTEKVYSEIVNLPISPVMRESEVFYVCETIISFLRKVSLNH